MKKSESIDQLATALAAAQGEIANAKMDAVNPHFKSKYATLASIIDAGKAPMAKHGLAVSQIPSILGDGTQVLTTLLMHKGGQWLESDYPIKPDKDTPQGVGSAITYARRYALAAMLGIAADEDDDGNEASQGNGRQQQPQQRRKAPPQQRQQQAPPAQQQAQGNDTTVPDAIILTEIRELEEDLDLNAIHQANARKKHAGGHDLSKCGAKDLENYKAYLLKGLQMRSEEAAERSAAA